MTIEEELKKLIIDRYGTLKNFVDQTTLKYSTVDSILKRGIRNSNVQNIIEICNTLSISVDELAHGRITPISSLENTTPGREFTHIKAYYSLFSMLDGKKLTKEELEFLQDGTDLLIEQLRKKRTKTSPLGFQIITNDLKKDAEKIITVDVNKLQPDFTLQVASADRPKPKTNSYKTVKVVGVRKKVKKTDD